MLQCVFGKKLYMVVVFFFIKFERVRVKQNTIFFFYVCRKYLATSSVKPWTAAGTIF